MNTPTANDSPRHLHWLVLVLLGAWPFISFLDHNRDDALLYWRVVTVYGATFVALLFVIVGVARLILGRGCTSRIAITIGIGAICFANYLTVASPLSNAGITLGSVKIAIWLVASLIIMGLTWRLSARTKTAAVLCFAAAAMVATPTVRLTMFAIDATQSNDREKSVMPSEATADSANRPNVYWILLDAYLRNDVLKAYFGYDNEPFLSALRDRHFFVAENSFANYASTKLSISTTGTMDYYLPVGEPMHPSLWTARLQGFNPVVDRFIAKGYRYIHAEPGSNNGKTRCGGREALCITSKPVGVLGLNEAEVGMLRLTALFPIIRRLFPDLLSFDFTTLNDVLDKLDLTSQIPTFAFIHILSPHPPPRYNADCSRVENIAFDLVGSDDTSTPASYLTDLKCLNPEVIEFVDEILANDPDDPIIIIQSDHGYRGDENILPAANGEAIDRRLIRFAVLQTMRLPQRCASMHRHDTTLVNTFRTVFRCLGDDDVAPISDNLFAHSNTTTWPLEIE